MDSGRRIIKYEELQEKGERKSGTLLRKKKVVYEASRWVTLCVHNDRIPLLEWYNDRRDIYEHEPLKVRDLIGVRYVNQSIGEDRCFIIAFSDEDKPAIELCASSPMQCSAWISCLSSTLQKLNCIECAENLYSEMSELERDVEDVQPMPTFAVHNDPPHASETTLSPPLPRKPVSIQPSASPSTSSGYRNVPSLNTAIPMNVPSVPNPNSPPSSSAIDIPRSQMYPHTLSISPTKMPRTPLRKTHTTSRDERSPSPPPLPPRRSTTAASPPTTSPITTSPSRLTDYTVLPTEQYDVLDPPPEENTRNPSERYTILPLAAEREDRTEQTPKDQFAQLSIRVSTATSSSGSSENRTSSSSDPTNHYHVEGGTLMLDDYEIPFDTSSPRPDPEIYASLGFDQHNFTETQTKPRHISLNKSLCIESLAFVEFCGKVWIAGWDPEKDKILRGNIHFGDEVTSVAGTPLHNIQQLNGLLHNVGMPGTPISMMIRTLPVGMTFTLMKPCTSSDKSLKKSLGFTFHRKSNGIESIEQRSIADLAQVTACVPPYVYGSSENFAVITELNNIPLNPFAKNEQFFRRFDSLPSGAFSLVIHPGDFVRLLREQLKQNKNYKKFLHDS